MATLQRCIVNDHGSSSSDIYLRIDAALLLIGHNNVFQTAAFCRMKEGQAVPGELRLWLKVFRGAHDVKTDQALTAWLRTNSGNKKGGGGGGGLACAWKMLRSEFVPHLAATIDALLGGVEPNSAAAAGAAAAAAVAGAVGDGAGLSLLSDAAASGAEATRVVVGLNPKTGFPILDAMMHALIRSVVAEKQQEYSSAAMSAGAVVSGVARVVTAAFLGFGEGPEKHTFDSTHPNDTGAKIIAAGWKAALEELFNTS